MPLIFLNQTIKQLINPFQGDGKSGDVPGHMVSELPVDVCVTDGEHVHERLARIKGDWLVLCHECSSSLDVAWYLQKQGLFPDWASVLCGSQWAGRGRMERSWISPPGNLYAALSWPETYGPWENLIPIMAGYLMIRFMAGRGVFLRLKWPNDLLLEGKKVGGILAEKKKGKTIVGIGLNTFSSPETDRMRKENVFASANLRGIIPSGPVAGLWQEFISHGRIACNHITERQDTSDFLSQVEPLLAFKDSPVRVIDSEAPLTGYITGLAGDGGLRLSRGKSEKIIYSGSIIPVTDG